MSNLTPSHSDAYAVIPALLEGFVVDSNSSLSATLQKAIWVARRLQDRAGDLQTSEERRQQAELDRMMQSPGDKATLVSLTDQAFRSEVWGRAADQLIHVLDAQGIPRFFSPIERTLLRGFQSFGAYLPGVAMPLVKEKMQQETANVVLPAEADLLRGHLEQRRSEGVRMNVNQLGEALLGEREAQRRLEGYLSALQKPEVEVISVKISTIYSQISNIARRHTVDVLSDRLELLYRAAARGTFTHADGKVVPKFVYLDMEEYRDLHLTADAFMNTLDRDGLDTVNAGIVLQAYVPDSFDVQKQIIAWARERVRNGGAPITMRIVKGANMEMERVEASSRGWPQAPYRDKQETDANYARMLHEGLLPDNISAVHLGIASHNLFTLAYGLVAASEAQALEYVQFEMLEGMANHQRRALFELTNNMLLYAPTCFQRDFIHAIGYLVRRLDENTGPNNFLRHAFSISTDDKEWDILEQQFLESVQLSSSVYNSPRRQQDRCKESLENRYAKNIADHSNRDASSKLVNAFSNEPDTDFSLKHHSAWAESIVLNWEHRHSGNALEVPLSIANDQLAPGEDFSSSYDPSRPGMVVAKYRKATIAEVDRAVSVASADLSGWRNCSMKERRSVLAQVANEIASSRAELLGAMLTESGKLLIEGDPEVSEAIDFCRFYGDSAVDFDAISGISPRGKGVVAVVSPWNFPLAIPCGGIAAALAAGNTVILKPASDTVLIAYLLCNCFWRAGVPREALQFVPCSGSTAGQHLVTHSGVDAVILTGGTETAQSMLNAKPALNLYAETGGKNATIVTALADRDLAIKNVLHSAFGHSGQKCSATSLLILEEEVYNDQSFRHALIDATESLSVGSAWNLATKVGPLIRPPSGDLEKSLKELEPGESWCVMPELHVEGNPSLVSPGIKWDVQPGSFTHQTEFFGPVLGVMCAKNLRHAIELVNQTGFGLTSGLESLDDREQTDWRDTIRAGNLYINRSTTGAIVMRQPFGGMGKSNVGPGLKAGGPNYVAQFMQFSIDQRSASERHSNADPETFSFIKEVASDLDLSDDLTCHLLAVADDYIRTADEEFKQEHDHFRLLGEDNHRRYLPMEVVRVRVSENDTPDETILRIIAGRILGCRIIVSSSPNRSEQIRSLLQAIDIASESWAGGLEILEETDHQLAEAVRIGRSGRVRFSAPESVPEVVRQATSGAMLYLADTPITFCGRIDLLWCLQEQSISHVYHRYGNLGSRANELRDEPV